MSVLLQFDDDEDLEICEPTKAQPNSEGTHIETKVSLNSVVGLSSPKTMKLRGQINGHEVIVMIDPSATHNFISTRLIQQLKLHVVTTKEFGVSLGNGESIKGSGECKGITLQFAEVDVREDFLPFQLGNSDVLLGVQWLEKLGHVTTNWKSQRMSFKVGSRTVVLQGDASLTHTKVSLKAMIKTVRKEGGGLLVEVRQMEKSEDKAINPDIPMFLQPVLNKFGPVFKSTMGLPPYRGHEHAIVLKEGSNPVSIRPYRYPQFQKDEIEKLVKEMLDAGIIQPSVSPFSSPVLLVKKKTGAWRFCVDYRALNKETVPDKFLIPVIDELLDELHGARYFSKLDLKSGYHQIRVRDADVFKTAFRTHEGHYEFLVMPFGLSNAPSTFQSLMNNIFKPLLRKTVLVFFDDILIYSRSQQEHSEHVAAVLQILQANSLVVNPNKCEWGKEQIEYLGHVVSSQGVSADASKVQDMVDWAIPSNLRELRGFLGLTGYYQKFVANYAQIAQSLTNQLRKDQFGWDQSATLAFEQLKQAMITAPVLAIPDFNTPFVVETDASGYGRGAVLLQRQRPIAYFSKLLGPRTRLKAIYDKELIAICLAVLKWKHYLLGCHFFIHTDQ